MKTRIIALACFVLASILGSTSASAQMTNPPGDAGVSPPAPPAATSAPATDPASQSCSLKEQECNKGFDQCKKDQEMLIDWAKKQCPLIAGMPDNEILESARTGKDAPKKPRRPRKPRAGKPKAPKATKVTVEVKVPLYGESEPVAPNAACPNGSFKLPVGFDKNANGKLDADEVIEKLQSGCNGKDGAPGKPGKPGKNGANSYTTQSVRFSSHADCPAGGSRSTNWTDLNGNGILDLDKDEVIGDVVVCDGKPGSAGRPGLNGDTRVQFGLGLRASAIWSENRPVGASAAPEAQLELWLAPTVEFVLGIAWAPGGDRNMVVTGQLRHRALNKRLGLGFGIQYQGWNLEGNKALWQSVLGMGSAQLVLVDSKWIDVSVDAGLLVGLDGYDDEAQFAAGFTGGFNGSLKF
ncbi:MAG: hypothetical protein QY323_02685 [Patescibacteria group bacterium]|nr:MAG: hypothetical protein QY323_02685 [Patescibacteria group bacterium]